MNDWMPTTEEVRERFIDGFPIDTWAVARDSVGQDFDRWMRQVKAEAWDEGYRHGANDVLNEVTTFPWPNPYLNGDIK